MEIKASSVLWSIKTEGIVSFTLAVIRKDFVGLRNFSKSLCGFFFVVDVFVWMPFYGKFFICFLDVLQWRIFSQTKDFVIVASFFTWHEDRQ